jgi:hypothetical protein
VESIQHFRAMGSLFRQFAVFDPVHSWKYFIEAHKWSISPKPRSLHSSENATPRNPWLRNFAQARVCQSASLKAVSRL